MSHPSFEQASQLVIGTAPVPIRIVESHPFQRSKDPKHVTALLETFSTNILLRWSHPIEVVLSQPVPEEWKERLRTNLHLPTLPEGVRLICISGQHRIAAGVQLLKMLQKKGKTIHDSHLSRSHLPLGTVEQADGITVEQLGHWPALIYESSTSTTMSIRSLTFCSHINLSMARDICTRAECSSSDKANNRGGTLARNRPTRAKLSRNRRLFPPHRPCHKHSESS
jgi:hypothetical protein